MATSVRGDRATHHAVAQRFEAKYLLNPVQHWMVRDFVEGYTRPDPHNAMYPVTSVYFDNGGWTSFRSSLYGEKNRFKLRVRTYEDAPEAPCFLEVKQRIGRVISKKRAMLKSSLDAAMQLDAAGSEGELAHPGRDEERDALDVFQSLRESIGAWPRIGVRYCREAYMSAMDEPVRITFDSELSYLPADKLLPGVDWSARGWRRAEGAVTVLEVKFTDAFPYWIRQMITRFELERISLAKYVVCVKALGHDGGLWAVGDEAMPAWTH